MSEALHNGRGGTITYQDMLICCMEELHFYGGTVRTVAGTCPLVTVVPSPMRAHILWMYIHVFTHYNVKQKLNIVCMYSLLSSRIDSILSYITHTPTIS